MKPAPVWPSVPIGLIAEVTLGKMLRNTATEKEYIERPYLHAANIRDLGVLSTEHSHRTMWFSEEEIERLSLLEGDVVVAEGGAVGKSAYVSSNIDGYGFQNSILRIRANPKNSDGRFIQYCLQSSFDRGEIAQACSTVSIPHFPAEKVNRFRIPFPPSTTQRRISDYLDQETAEIDSAVAELERYVELLEMRRRVISESLLAKVPYSMCAVGLIASVTLGKMLSTKTDASQGLIQKYLRAAHIQPKGQLDLSVAEKQMLFSEDEARRLNLKARDIVVVEGGAVGRSAYLDSDLPGWGFQNSINRVRISTSKANPRFVYYMLLRAHSNGSILAATDTATIPHFTAEKLTRFRIPFPSLEDQQHIVDQLDRENSKINAIVSESTKLRDLLLKRRSVLITEVVTGRKQV